ncbi:allantoinase AllB [Rubrobacter calidifluminis]|uniref:allantoinase AllB n=1 Tax=Rubrobacter calidifluminis TaxID=1392640 RepID=UPI00235FD8EB|nr:allantoinase AllB [Rubrobacter calidifluminis]
MAAFDLIVRGGTVVRGDGCRVADVGVADGVVSAVGPELEGGAREEIDARGLLVLPGAIDAHVHFNEPGRTGWEGFASGTRALATGGTTLGVEMPLNAYPPTTDAEGFDLKLAAAKRAAFVDFALWGGIVPGKVDRMEELAERGVAGFKAFMSATGTPDFEAADDLTLYEGMREAARLGLPVLVHAENRRITDALSHRAASTLRTTMRDYLDSRPVIAELEAISRAILFASEVGCSLHVVHVSTGRGVALVAEARSRGVDVTCETCPHYLLLTDEDAERIGAAAKCAPPLRPREELESLWEEVLSGDVSFVTSDHSPCPPDMKAGEDMFRVWGGISGCQSLLAAILTEGHHRRGLSLERVAELLSGAVARRFGFTGKGGIGEGNDADLVLVDPGEDFTLREEDLQYRHPISPYVGMRFRGRVVRTLVRGRTVFAEGKVAPEPAGRFVRPQREKGER